MSHVSDVNESCPLTLWMCLHKSYPLHFPLRNWSRKNTIFKFYFGFNSGEETRKGNPLEFIFNFGGTWHPKKTKNSAGRGWGKRKKGYLLNLISRLQATSGLGVTPVGGGGERKKERGRGREKECVRVCEREGYGERICIYFCDCSYVGIAI